MSRSYKKTHIIKDKTKGMKKLANKSVRHNLDLQNGNSYKKVFNSWDICDWRFICDSNCKICENNKNCTYLRK